MVTVATFSYMSSCANSDVTVICTYYGGGGNSHTEVARSQLEAFFGSLSSWYIVGTNFISVTTKI